MRLTHAIARRPPEQGGFRQCTVWCETYTISLTTRRPEGRRIRVVNPGSGSGSAVGWNDPEVETCGTAVGGLRGHGGVRGRLRGGVTLWKHTAAFEVTQAYQAMRITGRSLLWRGWCGSGFAALTTLGMKLTVEIRACAFEEQQKAGVESNARDQHLSR